MKITVIGSASRTGIYVLEQGVHRGHEITAFTRRPQKLANVTGLKEVVVGDGLNLLGEKINKAHIGKYYSWLSQKIQSIC